MADARSDAGTWTFRARGDLLEVRAISCAPHGASLSGVFVAASLARKIFSRRCKTA